MSNITVLIGDFNTPHSSMDRSDRKQNIHSSQAHMELFSKIDHMLGQKKGLCNLRWFKMYLFHPQYYETRILRRKPENSQVCED